MDLVSSTLDKYLNHRFNGNGLSDTTDNVTPQSGSDDSSMTIYDITFKNLLPCCIKLHDNLKYIAAGFENSHIYLWDLTIQTPSSSNNIGNAVDSGATALSDKIITNNTDPSAHHLTSDNKTIKVTTMSKLLAHSGSVYGIEFANKNNNQDLMLSCSEDATIRLWCLNTKCNLTVYRGHNYPIWSIQMGPHGQYFATASMDSTARLWHLDKMCPLRIFCGHDDDVECISFHPNEKYLATGSSDATVRLWSISDGKMVRLMVGHKHSIESLSFLPNGKFLASASSDGAIKVWNLTTNSVTTDLSVPASHCISFSPEQKFISSCGVDNIMRLYRITKESSLTEEKRIDFKGRRSRLVQTHFHRDNKLFVFGHELADTNAPATATSNNLTKE